MNPRSILSGRSLLPFLLILVLFAPGCSPQGLPPPPDDQTPTPVVLHTQTTAPTFISTPVNIDPTATPICLPTQPLAATPTGGGTGKILFSSYRDGESEIYTIDANGSNLTRLTELDDRVGQPVWSPDGQRIAFVRQIEGVYLEIWEMRTDGSSLARIPTNMDLVDTEPAWSPDGSRIAFTSNVDSRIDYRGRSVPVFNIFMVNVDGSDLTRLTDGETLDTSPDWSPDGRRIAYQSNRVGNFEIYTLAEDGVTPRNLTNRLTDETSPAWSPDGERIAFVSNRDGNQEIYIMDADGENQIRLTDHPLEDHYPSWSPDGQSIAFYSNRDGNYEIYTMKADGSSVTRLTDHYNFDGYPSWQPVVSDDIARETISDAAWLDAPQRVLALLGDCLGGNLIP